MTKASLIALILILVILLTVTGTLLAFNLMQDEDLDTIVLPLQANTNVQEPLVMPVQILVNNTENDDLDEEEIPVTKDVLEKAPITEQEAKNIASALIPGRITDVEAEWKRGRETYVVEIRDGNDEVDVIVDIETGDVLGIERD